MATQTSIIEEEAASVTTACTTPQVRGAGSDRLKRRNFNLIISVSSRTLSGKNCELCVSGFFMLEESDPAPVDVCWPCDCDAAGTVGGSMECAQVHTNTNSCCLILILTNHLIVSTYHLFLFLLFLVLASS